MEGKNTECKITFQQDDFAALINKIGELRGALFDAYQSGTKQACLKAGMLLEQVSGLIGNGIVENA